MKHQYINKKIDLKIFLIDIFYGTQKLYLIRKKKKKQGFLISYIQTRVKIKCKWLVNILRGEDISKICFGPKPQAQGFGFRPSEGVGLLEKYFFEQQIFYFHFFMGLGL